MQNQTKLMWITLGIQVKTALSTSRLIHKLYKLMKSFLFYSALMYASIFGNLTAIIQRLYSRTSRFHRDLRVIEDFVQFYKIPKSTKEELDEYFRHEWAYTKGVDMETVCVHQRRENWHRVEGYKNSLFEK